MKRFQDTDAWVTYKRDTQIVIHLHLPGGMKLNGRSKGIEKHFTQCNLPFHICETTDDEERDPKERNGMRYTCIDVSDKLTGVLTCEASA